MSQSFDFQADEFRAQSFGAANIHDIVLSSSLPFVKESVDAFHDLDEVGDVLRHCRVDRDNIVVGMMKEARPERANSTLLIAKLVYLLEVLAVEGVGDLVF